MHYDSPDMSASLTPEKRVKMQKLVNAFAKRKSCKIREFAKFLGNIVASCPAIKYSWAYTKNFERAKYLSLRKAANNYEAKMEIDASLLPDFQ
ncbi:unnamed protein product [Acanthoscelides obtectus]|uniref:Uncharacterized protein n=1 Tax=Acanthoscelides obtectus TaxID=200917 RepID=A0A9P0KS15_ACAOB|nr:unnamed protein product [Acanthoscelides obtectus]CAK1641643.1 hypothetical protein AOBTE_LOCUS12523 [Acanthoscelides obtectus]